MPIPGNLPKEGQDIFESVMSSLKGKTNPRTNKPYTDEERGMIAWSAVKKKFHKKGEDWEAKSEESYPEFEVFTDTLEFKSEDGKYYFKGYLSTPDLDYVNDLVTPDCMKDMVSQIQNGAEGKIRSIKGSENHDVYWKQDPQMIPISRLTGASLDSKGLMVEGIFNSEHPDFQKYWNQIQNGFYDGLSIEYAAKDFAYKDMSGKKIRILNKVELKGYAHTPRPANPFAKLTDFFVKSLELADAEDSIKAELTLDKIDYFIEDEKKASEEYKSYGLFELAGDEEKHHMFFVNLKKEYNAFPNQGSTEEKAEKQCPEIKEEAKMTETKAEVQPVPQTQVKEEEMSEDDKKKKEKEDKEKADKESEEKKACEGKKVEVKAETKDIDIKSLVEEIKTSILKDIKEELKSLIPEKKSLSDAPVDNPLETKAISMSLVDRVCKQLGG